jgi:predicted metalloprotease
MTFQEGGSFNSGRVGTRSGAGKGMAIGGGGIGAALVTLLIVFLTRGQADPTQLLQGAGGAETEGTVGECSADQANSDRVCRLSATVDSLDTVWQATLTQAGAELPAVWSFTDQTDTPCGTASASSGPFYCPNDQAIYLDVGFFDDLTTQLGAEGGPLAEEYVVAHEYGHHIQEATGIMAKANRGGTGATSDSVRVELQADCFAGIWAGKAASTVDPDTGVTYLKPITQQELETALDAAAAVGDDHIQQQSGGGVNPDSFTHGTSAQRQKWFTKGYQGKTIASCDTFSASSL